MPLPFRSAQGTIVPTVFIGMGGTGSRIVDRIAARVEKLPNWDSQIRPLTQFVALDTNKLDQNKLQNVPPGNRILISGVDKPAVIEGYRIAKNRQVTSWIDESYKPREGTKPGAGQIRIESRLGFFYHSGRIRQRLEQIVDNITRPNITWRQSNPPYFYVYLVSTLAGGTGSGSFLSMAYLVQDVIRNRGKWQPRVIAKLLLSTLMTDRVSSDLHPDIHSNSYAALKELEHLTKLNYPQVKNEGRTYEEFAYWYNEALGPSGDPPRVQSGPFFLSLIYDRAERFAIPDLEAAVADASYLELFTPNIDNFASSLDNYEKHLQDLTQFPGDLRNIGLGYTKNFGAMGAAAMVMPTDDLVEYCSLRFAAEAIRTQITFGVDTSNLQNDRAMALAKLAVNYDSPAFRNLVDEEQERVINQAFVDSVMELKRQDERDGQTSAFWFKLVESVETGPVAGVDEKTGEPRRGESLIEIVIRKLKEERERAVNKISIRQRGFAFHRESIGMFADHVSRLKEDVSASRVKVGELLPGLRRSAEEGEAILALKLDPLTERYLVLRLIQEIKGKLISSAETLVKNLESLDMRKSSVEDAFEDWRQRLTADAAQPSLLGRARSIFGKDPDEAFLNTKNDAETYYKKIASGTGKLLDAEILLTQLRSLGEFLQRRANQYARLSRYMSRVVHELEEKAEQVRAGQGGTIPLALQVEVLQRLEEPKDRIWNWVYDELFIKGGQYRTVFDRKVLAETISAQLRPSLDPNGRLRSKTDDEMVKDLRTTLLDLGVARTSARIVGGPGDNEFGLDLYSALRLEAELVKRDEGRRRGALRENEKVPEQDIEQYIENKLRALHDLSGVMARISSEAWRAQNDGVLMEQTRHIVHGLHTANNRSLAPAAFFVRMTAILGLGADKVNVAEWHDPNMIIVYDVQAPIPLYYFRPVCSELENSYYLVAGNLKRGYKLHTDSRWEEGLPNLNPTRAAVLVGWVMETLLNGMVAGMVKRDDKGAWLLRRPGASQSVLLGGTLSKALYKLGERGADPDLKRAYDTDISTALAAMTPQQLVEEHKRVAASISQRLEQLKERQISLGRQALTPEDFLDIPVYQTMREMAESAAERLAETQERAANLGA